MERGEIENDELFFQTSTCPTSTPPKKNTRFADLHGFAKPNDDRALRLMDAAASDVALALGAAGKKRKGGGGGDGVSSNRESGSSSGGAGGGGADPSSSSSPSSSSGVVLGFGTSDEYSLVLGPSCRIYDRREAKLVSVAASTFAASYVRRWDSFFCPGRTRRRRRRENNISNGDDCDGDDSSGDTPLRSTPSFDCRAVLYPTTQHLRDYLSWRQADAHVNCQYNVCFWTLVQKDGKSKTEAAAALKGTRTADKNELLFQRGVNYSRLPARHRKGSVLLRKVDVLDAETEAEEQEAEEEEREEEGNGGTAETTCGDDGNDDEENSSSPSLLARLAPGWAVAHCDIIKDDFWDARPHLIISRETTKL